MFKVKATTILFMILSAMQLHCMIPARRALQQIPVRTIFSQSIRALSSQGICDCSSQECKIKHNSRLICKKDDFLDEINIVNAINNNTTHSVQSHVSPVSSGSEVKDSDWTFNCNFDFDDCD